MPQDEELRIEGEDEEQGDIAPPERRVFWEPQAPSVFDLHRRYQRGTLKLRPAFQRRIVWDDKKQSRFIESILLDVPIPYLYLAEEEDGTQVVVDGQQRLYSLFTFLEGSFTLRPGVMSEIQGKSFRDLEQQHQDHIEQKPLPVVLIKRTSHPTLKVEVFDRLNTGAVQLNAQELRNCLYAGPFNNVLIELSEEPLFQRLLGLSGPDRRMKDVELVLRFFAFLERGYENYGGRMRGFLDGYMKDRRQIDDAQSSA